MTGWNTVPSLPLPGTGGPGWKNSPATMAQATASAQAAMNTGILGTEGSLSDKWMESQGAFGHDAMFGGVDQKTGIATKGWVDPVMGAVGSLADSWLAMQQLDLARDQFNFQKDAFSKQFENQRSLTNTRLRDRQRARLGANPNAYQSEAEYMSKNGV